MKRFWRLRSSLRRRFERADGRLSARAESRLGLVPALPVGPEGTSRLQDIVLDLLTELRPAVVCDIGGNQGAAGRRADVVSPGMHWLDLAVSDAAGTVTLDIRRGPDRTQDGEAPREGTRDAATLDDILQRAAPDGTVVLRIDAAGSAAKLLEGARLTLQRADLLQVKVAGFAVRQDQTVIDEVLDQLAQQGFVPVLRDREAGDAEFNVVFLRRSAAGADHLIGRIASSLDRSRPSRATTPSQLSPATVPVLIPCFNNPSYVRQMLDQLARLGFEQVTLVDNASDSDDMRALLSRVEAEGVQVERLTRNLGPRLSIFVRERLARLPRYFCVTDPDLAFNPQLPPDFLDQLRDVQKRYGEVKAGFALDISQPWRLKPDSFKIGQYTARVDEWEEQFWRKRIGHTAGGDAIFRAVIDTTFALYDRHRIDGKHPVAGVRVAGRFTAEHLPWLNQSTMSSGEEEHYRRSQKFSQYLAIGSE